ncbi:MAG: dihydroorotase [Treponema sp.]|nr:dihydroorotase [Treponema sp.]
MPNLVIYNARLVDEHTDAFGAVLISNGKILSVFKTDLCTEESAVQLAEGVFASCDEPVELVDAKGLVLAPAFIDMHVHLRYPGQTQKEDLNSGLHATAAGGFGTIVAMPNTNPVVSSAELAHQIEKEAEQIGLTKVFQTVSITKDFGGKDVSHLNEIDRQTIPVITEDGHDVLSSSIMLEGMKIAGEKDVIVSCHSEDPELALKAKPYRAAALELMKKYNLSSWAADDEKSFMDCPVSVIDEIDNNLSAANRLLAIAEDSATYRNIQLAKEAGCHVHIAHCSTKNSIEMVRAAKKEIEQNQVRSAHFKVTCEVTPHHLALSGEEEPLIRALVNPPLRTEEDRLAVIEALRDGTADVISTDHAPHTADDKAAGSPGFSGAETAFAVCNTVLVKENGFTLSELSKLMSANPARILGLKKGLLEPGYDADLVILDTEKRWEVHGADFKSKGKATPFEDETLTGKVEELFIAGKRIDL